MKSYRLLTVSSVLAAALAVPFHHLRDLEHHNKACCAGWDDGSYCATAGYFCDHGKGLEMSKGYVAADAKNDRAAVVFDGDCPDSSTVGWIGQYCPSKQVYYATAWWNKKCKTYNFPKKHELSKMCVGDETTRWSEFKDVNDIDPLTHIYTYTDEKERTAIGVSRFTCMPFYAFSMCKGDKEGDLTASGAAEWDPFQHFLRSVEDGEEQEPAADTGTMGVLASYAQYPYRVVKKWLGYDSLEHRPAAVDAKRRLKGFLHDQSVYDQWVAFSESNKGKRTKYLGVAFANATSKAGDDSLFQVPSYCKEQLQELAAECF